MRCKKIRLGKQKQKDDENNDIIMDWQQEQREIQKNYLMIQLCIFMFIKKKDL